MEVKIKQGSEMLDATIEMVDGVMVVSPKKNYLKVCRVYGMYNQWCYIYVDRFSCK